MQKAVDNWGKFYEGLRENIDEEFKGMNDPSGNPIGPQIKLADSEYGFTIDHDNPLQNNQKFTNVYMHAMMDMFHQRGIWLANQFTIQSHHGEALDMLTDYCTAKPLYNSYKAISAADPLNK